MASHNSRCFMAAVLLALVAVASARSLTGAPSTPQQQQQQRPQQDASGSNPKTCCTCKCVIAAKQPNIASGMLGAVGPTYSKKDICKNGFFSSCDAVCLVNNGSYTSYNAC